MRIAYTYGGSKKVTEHIVDSEEQVYYDKYAKTSAEQVIVNKIQDTRLDTVLRDLETRIAGDASIPSQVGNTGKFLSTDGSDLIWEVVDALPGQSGNANKFLSTNGSTAFWATPVRLTSTVYPKVSTNKIGSYGVSEEAARADHEHPIPVYFIESYMVAVGGETELTLTDEQYPSNNKPTGFHLYRNGLLLTPGIDYTLDTSTKKVTFSKACNPKENIIIILGYLIGDTNINGSNSLSNLIEILTTDEVPLMNADTPSIGVSNKAARADHEHEHDTTKADKNSPNFSGTPKINNVPIATTNYVDNKVSSKLEGIIPEQSSSTAGKVLASDGESVFWKEDRDRQELPNIELEDIGKILAVDVDQMPVWTSLDSELPNPAYANIGSVLTLDNNKNPVWNSIPRQLPTIDNSTANKVLTNDGTVLKWEDNEHIVLSNGLPLMNNREPYAGVLNEAARIDHIHERDNTKADKDSPTFTGNPQAPTPLLSNNSNSIATTSYVNQLISREIDRVNNPNNNYIEEQSETLYTLKNVNFTLQDLGNLDEAIDELTIDFSKGNNALAMINNDLSINFTINSDTNSDYRKVSLTVYNANQYAITWPENVHWDGIYAPVIETVMTIIEFITFNNGDEWYGKVFGSFN